MPCPYLIQSQRNLCAAFNDLFHPSIFEEKKFCRSEYFGECGLFQRYSETDRKVNKEQYLDEIYKKQFEAFTSARKPH